MKKVLALVSLLLILVGCNSGGSEASKEGGLTCTKEQSSSIFTEYEIESDGKDADKITKIVRTYKAAIPDVNFQNRTVEELQQLYESQYINPQEKNKGISIEVTVDEKEKEVKVVAIVEVEEADMEKVAMMFEMTNSKKSAEVKKDLEDQGFVCKSNMEK